jgi:hypothetical protein
VLRRWQTAAVLGFGTKRPRAARKCSNQTDLHLTLANLLYGSNLPERPSPTSVRLVCIQKARGSSPLSSTGQRPNAILKAPEQSQAKSRTRG